MLAWFRKWFKREPREWTADDIDHEDPNARAMIAQVINTRKTMVGTYDDAGNFTTRVVEEPEYPE
jgi:hypothetical protein